MSRIFSFVFASALMALSVSPSSAQVQTGTSPFGSFGGGPDVVNLGNLNSHLVIPVVHKPGRGTNFNYDLALSGIPSRQVAPRVGSPSVIGAGRQSARLSQVS